MVQENKRKLITLLLCCCCLLICGAASFAVSARVHAFYYPWYHNMTTDGNWDHWADSTHWAPDNLPAAFYPMLGPYSANDSAAVHQHMQWLHDAGVGVIASSWWGQGSDSDMSVAQLLDVANLYGIKVCFHIEPFGGRTGTTAKDAVIYIIDNYGTHPAVFREPALGNRPIFYFFASNDTPDYQWASAWDSIRGTSHDAVVIGDCFDHARILAGHWDGFYNYFPGQDYSNWNSHASWAQSNGKFMVPPVGVGWNTSAIGGYGPPTIERGRGEYCDTTWSAAAQAANAYTSVRYVGITSFNEWHEGTQIEPAVPTSFPEGRTYLDYLPDGPTMYIDKTASWAAVLDPAASGKVQCEDYSGGTSAQEGVDYHDTTSGNSGGQYRNHRVDIQACDEGGYNVGWVVAGEWLRYAGVQVTWTNNTEIRLRASSWNSPRQVRFCDGSLSNTILTLTVPVTGGFQEWLTLSGIITLAQGSHTIYLVADEGDINFNWFEVRPYDIVAPLMPTNQAAVNITPNSVRISWQDKSFNEMGFKVYAEPGVGPPTTLRATAAANGVYWDYNGLTPNARYAFQIAATNAAGDSGKTANTVTYTMASSPSIGNNIACNKSVGVWYPAGTTFQFTNPAGFGAGTDGGSQYKVSRYTYAWDKNPTHTFNETESYWFSGTLSRTANQGDGAYYLHLRSHNGFNAPNPVTLDYGPFYADVTPPTTSASPPAGVYNTALNVSLAANESATIYYTTDGSAPTTGSSVYGGPIPVASDMTLRYFAVDTVGNAESPAKQEVYAILTENGSIAEVKGLSDGAPVRLGDKALYLKSGGTGYIEEPARFAGLRIEGSISANAGELVCLTGVLRKPIGAEPYVQLSALTAHGLHSALPVGMSNRAVQTNLADGLWVTAWGTVRPGSIIGNSYYITDGSDEAGIKVITPGPPSVSDGQFVPVTGAAGFDGERVIYIE
ncbi:MAG: chitobiase/beta-hexosaminidase C-terminal domain-containing protein [Armatimonadota bacterium]|nr:chitobiase/beta-hexosaminidase C-terminal domain-containing protein [Armatimonadota bacterium]